jgi:hypothetical protein
MLARFPEPSDEGVAAANFAKESELQPNREVTVLCMVYRIDETIFTLLNIGVLRN